ncbi:MAG: DUF1540 domain-containing protein [Desulfuromonadales bacterium]
MEMPKVMDCSVDGCAYNNEKECHAMAITIGDAPDDPSCDTYLEAPGNGGVMDMTAGVGACKSYECSHNTDYECTASNVRIGMKGDEPDCLTFTT